MRTSIFFYLPVKEHFLFWQSWFLWQKIPLIQQATNFNCLSGRLKNPLKILTRSTTFSYLLEINKAEEKEPLHLQEILSRSTKAVQRNLPSQPASMFQNQKGDRADMSHQAAAAAAEWPGPPQGCASEMAHSWQLLPAPALTPSWEWLIGNLMGSAEIPPEWKKLVLWSLKPIPALRKGHNGEAWILQ